MERILDWRQGASEETRDQATDDDDFMVNAMGMQRVKKALTLGSDTHDLWLSLASSLEFLYNFGII